MFRSEQYHSKGMPALGKPIETRQKAHPGKLFSFPLLDSLLFCSHSHIFLKQSLCLMSPWLSLWAVTVPWFFAITKEGGSKVSSSFLMSFIHIHNHIHFTPPLFFTLAADVAVFQLPHAFYKLTITQNQGGRAEKVIEKQKGSLRYYKTS